MEKTADVDARKIMISEYEGLLKKLPGIISVKIITNDLYNIVELHILSDTLRTAKQIVRDIQSALLTQYNLQIDHKIISVAQIENDILPAEDFRLAIKNIQIVTEGAKAEVVVSLSSKDGKIYTGVTVGGNALNTRPRLIAEASLKAIHSFLNTEYAFILIDVTKFIIASRPAVAVAISYLDDFGETSLIGSSFVNKDENESVVKATLNAINRKMLYSYNKSQK